MIKRLKERLATIDQASWHYRLVKNWLSAKKLENTHKACFYWWVRVPSALLWSGCWAVLIVLGAIVFCGIIVPIGIVVMAVTMFFGYTPAFITPINTEEYGAGYSGCHVLYPYKYSPRKDRTRRFAPYQFAWPPLALAAVVLGSYEGNDHPHTAANVGFGFAVFIGALIALMIIGAIRRTTRRKLGRTISSIWDRACPNITFVESPTEQQEAA